MRFRVGRLKDPKPDDPRFEHYTDAVRAAHRKSLEDEWGNYVIGVWGDRDWLFAVVIDGSLFESMEAPCG